MKIKNWVIWRLLARKHWISYL